MSKPTAKASTPAPAAPQAAPSAAAPSVPVDAALIAEGNPDDVTAADIRAALGLPPAGAPAADDADDAGDEDLSPEERSAAEAELAADDDTEASGEEADADDDAAAPAAEASAPAEEPAAAPVADDAAAKELQAKLTAAENEAAALRERLAAREAADAGRTDPQVLEGITDFEGLAKLRKQAVDTYTWAIRHPEGAEIPDGKGGTVTFTREQMLATAAEAFATVHERIPGREAYLRDAAAREGEALNAYPWLKETARGLGAEAAKILSAAPGLRRAPEHKLIAADAALGARLRSAGITVNDTTLTRMIEAAKAAQPAAATTTAARPAATAPRVPPSAPRAAGVVPPRTRGNEVAVRAAQKRLASGGGKLTDLTASIAAKLGR